MMRKPLQRARVRPMTPWTRAMLLVLASFGLALAACNRPAPAAPPREEGIPGFPALLREQHKLGIETVLLTTPKHHGAGARSMDGASSLHSPSASISRH